MEKQSNNMNVARKQNNSVDGSSVAGSRVGSRSGHWLITTPSERYIFKGQIEVERNITWLLSARGTRTFQAPTECFRQIEVTEFLVHKMNAVKEL